MPFTTLAEQIHDVPEKFDVTTLVAADRNTLGIFLNGSGNDLLNRTVMPQMDYLGTRSLEDTADYVNGGIVPVEKAGSGHETDLASGLEWLSRCLHKKISSL